MGEVFASVREDPFELLNQFGRFFSYGMLANRTLAGDAVEAVMFGKFNHLFFANIDERTNDGNAIIEHGDLGEIPFKFSFMEKIHEKRLDAVVPVVAKSDNVSPNTAGFFKEESSSAP